MANEGEMGMLQRKFKKGDLVIYRKTKHSASPGPRAQKVEPAPHGEDYSYLVEKFWVVAEADEETVLLRTRRGKEHRLSANNPNLRHARWWERWFYRNRFPQMTAGTATVCSSRQS